MLSSPLTLSRSSLPPHLENNLANALSQSCSSSNINTFLKVSFFRVIYFIACVFHFEVFSCRDVCALLGLMLAEDSYECMEFLRTGVTHSCEPLCRFWELKQVLCKTNRALKYGTAFLATPIFFLLLLRILHLIILSTVETFMKVNFGATVLLAEVLMGLQRLFVPHSKTHSFQMCNTVWIVTYQFEIREVKF